jgi:hypothetical protein
MSLQALNLIDTLCMPVVRMIPVLSSSFGFHVYRNGRRNVCQIVCQIACRIAWLKTCCLSFFPVAAAFWAMSLSLILSFAQYPHQALADDQESNEFNEILRTRSIEDISKIRARHERQRRARIVCEVQLKNLRIPSACFELAKLAKLAKEVGQKGEREIASLGSICRDRAAASSEPEELKRLLSAQNIPKPCREVAKRRVEDLAYARGLEPADFTQRD